MTAVYSTMYGVCKRHIVMIELLREVFRSPRQERGVGTLRTSYFV